MRELKFITSKLYTVSLEYNNGESKGIKLKPYYTHDEKFNIYSLMSAQGNSFNMDMALIVGTAKACTNIDFDGLEDKEIYDIVQENLLIGDFKYEIEEYTDMVKLIERDNSTSELLKPIMVELETKLKNFDMSKVQGLLGGILTNAKTNKKSN